MTYNVFGGTLSLTQSINQSSDRIAGCRITTVVLFTLRWIVVHIIFGSCAPFILETSVFLVACVTEVVNRIWYEKPVKCFATETRCLAVCQSDGMNAVWSWQSGMELCACCLPADTIVKHLVINESSPIDVLLSWSTLRSLFTVCLRVYLQSIYVIRLHSRDFRFE